MSDIKLDLDPTSPNFNDLLLVNGDLVLVNGTEGILQNVLQRLRTYFGEWFLNNSIGVPYFQQILVKNPDQGKIDGIFINAILGTVGIDSLTDYSFELNTETRMLNITFKAIATTGPVTYAGQLQV